MNELTSNEYAELLGKIKQRIRSAQYDALKAVNKELITLYWDIGKMIVEHQKGASWGKSVVEKIANEKLQPIVAEIGWTHNLLIMEKCKDNLEREFYIRMTRKMGWSKPVLIHHIENQTYKKTLLNQTNFDKTIPEDIRNQAKLAMP